MATTDIQEIRNLCREVANGFKAMNQNLTDMCKSLRVLTEKVKEETDDWIPVFSGKNAGLPTIEFDWVLVRIRALGRDGTPSGAIFPEPRIARFIGGRWEAQDANYIYDTKEFPFQVVYWKPIPGYLPTDILYCNNKVVGTRYEEDGNE